MRVTREMERRVWLGEIFGVRARGLTDGWHVEWILIKKPEACQGLPKAPRTACQAAMGFIMIPTSCPRGQGRAKQQSVPWAPCEEAAAGFPSGSTAAGTGRCTLRINESPGARQLASPQKDGLGWLEGARNLCCGSINVSHRLILSNFQVIQKFIKLTKTNLWKIELVTDRKPMIYCLDEKKCLPFQSSVC